jgi:acetyl-CoA carboxylase biotin carboxylase subunit
MNTRLQVEHPVTELVTGVDLVQWQLRIAAGERLGLPPAMEPRGWAIECRITAEDVHAGFLPSAGRVTYLRVPGGPGVRWDGGVEVGSEIGLHYDSLLGKLITWGSSRALAIARMERALAELRIVGVETSREFHLRVLEHEEFRRGAFDIQWLERSLDGLTSAAAPGDERRMAAVAAALLVHGRHGAAAPNGADRTNARPVTGDDARGGSWSRAARLEALR